MKETVKTPGEFLGFEKEFNAGPGTYVKDGAVYSSRIGLQTVEKPCESVEKKSTVCVLRKRSQSIVPTPGVQVTARIAKVNPRLATADILCVGNNVVAEKFNGIVRQQDVRATEIDKVDMYNSFKPGDVIKAEVLSLGDSRAYFLSTAKNELGVVHAKSLAGASMVPISWQEMECPVTGQKELRKVAKV